MQKGVISLKISNVGIEDEKNLAYEEKAAKVKRILESLILLEKYPRSIINLNFDIISSQEDVFCQVLNLSVFGLLKNSIEIKEPVSCTKCVKKLNYLPRLCLMEPGLLIPRLENLRKPQKLLKLPPATLQEIFIILQRKMLLRNKIWKKVFL